MTEPLRISRHIKVAEPMMLRHNLVAANEPLRFVVEIPHPDDIADWAWTGGTDLLALTGADYRLPRLPFSKNWWGVTAGELPGRISTMMHHNYVQPLASMTASLNAVTTARTRGTDHNARAVKDLAAVAASLAGLRPFIEQTDKAIRSAAQERTKVEHPL